jgi:hypothetical protein
MVSLPAGYDGSSGRDSDVGRTRLCCVAILRNKERFLFLSVVAAFITSNNWA